MEVKAKVKYIKMSPRKIRLVTDLVKGLDIEEAIHQLGFISRKAGTPVLKLLNSVVANAEHNFNLKRENLYIKEILVEQGPTLKRWMPCAFGRATPIRKRSAHISIVLKDRVEAKKGKEKKRKEKMDKIERVEAIPKGEGIKEGVLSAEKSYPKQPEDKKPEIFDQRMKGKHRAKQNLDKLSLKGAKGVVKRIFRRKTV